MSRAYRSADCAKRTSTLSVQATEGDRGHRRVNEAAALRVLAAGVHPVALFLDLWVAAFAHFAYCGLAYCRYEPGDLATPLVCLGVAWLLMFLAVVLPPWIPGWRRPVVAAAAGLVVAVAAAIYAFQPI